MHRGDQRMILITEFMDQSAVETLSAAHKTTYAPELADEQSQIPALMADIQALIVRNRTKVTADLLDAAPALKCVGRLGVGLDNIDLDACVARDVKVIPATGANNLSVAEYVITSAMVLLRNAYQAKHDMLAGNWPRMACAGRELSGKTLGLIGYGAISRETAGLALGLGMEVCAYDPFLPADDPVWGDTHCLSLDGVLESGDVISLHVPLTDETRHLMDTRRLAQMKPGAILINAARGGVADEAAMASALKAGALAGAALDVFENEPLTASDAEKFCGFNNLLLTPHIAGITDESNVRVSSMIAECVLAEL